MRIMFHRDYVIEIFGIEATPSWHPENGGNRENPDKYTVGFSRPVPMSKENTFEYVGEYVLDGTIETYEEAKKNFKEICKKLLTKGYCRDIDFENFTWF